MKNVEDIYPLSPVQQGMLFHSLYAPEVDAYFEQLCCVLYGNLNPQAFQKAWQQVVARHPVLRSTFVWEGLDEPLQVVRQTVELPWYVDDWQHLSKTEQQEQLHIFLQAECDKSFDFAQAPLMRWALIRLKDNAHQFIWSRHHLILDGWSMATLFKEVLIFYKANCQGQTTILPSVRPYRDYIAWLKQQDLTHAQTFWQHTLDGIMAPTPIAITPPLETSVDDDITQQQQECQLSATLTTQIEAFARQHHLTPNILLQGAWALLLSRYSRETDVVFGVTVSGRPATLQGADSMVGVFINTLPLRVSVSEESPLLAWLKDLQTRQAALQEYSYTPLVEIQGWSEIPRNLPLFESIMVFENYPVDAALQQNSHEQNGHRLEAGDFRWVERTNYPLSVVIAPDQVWSIRFSYDPQRFASKAMAHMLNHFETLLTEMVADPQQQLMQLSLIPSSERQHLLENWNQTNCDYGFDGCIHEMVEAQVAQTPDAIAVVLGNTTLTYRELDQRANQLAHALQALGVEPDHRVGLYLERSIELVVGLLGILKAGAAYLPLDPSYPQDRLAFMISDAGVQVLLTQSSLYSKLPVEHIPVLCLDRDAAVLATHSSAKPISSVEADHLAYVIYTSGSTGKPKGVAMPHYPLVNLIQWQRQDSRLGAGDRTLQFSPISFDMSFHEIFATWCTGGTLVMISESVRRNSETLLNYLVQESIARVFLPCVALQNLAAVSRHTSILPPLKEVMSSGEQLQINDEITYLFQRLPNCVLHNHYGPSENHVMLSCTLDGSADAWPALPPLGRPIANAKVYLLDAGLNPVPVGLPGEIYIGGVSLARGYLHRPDLTADRFIQAPFGHSEGERIYKTGDLARYRSDGQLEFLGRIDHQVKVRGFRIELGEIEVVLGQHPQVQQAVVTVHQGQTGSKYLVAYVVPTGVVEHPNSGGLHPEALRQFLSARLPEYAVPGALEILESLPLTPSGKVNRHALPDPQGRIGEDSNFVAPRTEMEAAIATIFSSVLGQPQIGIHQNFFELGGHSLSATQVVSRLRETFQVEFPLRRLFEAPTVAELGPAVVSLRQETLQLVAPPLEPISRNSFLPLSWSQERICFLEQLEGPSPIYNISAAVQLQGPLDVTALEWTFATIVERHEVLRTQFHWQEGQAVQVIADQHSFNIEHIDLTSLSTPERQHQIEQHLVQASQTPFDLTHAPLICIRLLKLASEEAILVVTMHHIISDGWSLGVMIREFSTLYSAFSQGLPSPLPVLSIQYADFAQWQRNWLQGEVLDQQLTYWQDYLSGAPTFLELPTDNPRPNTQTFKGEQHTFTLSPDLSQKLQQLSQKTSSTLFMILFSAFSILLHRYSGQDDILVGTPIANRNREKIEDLIGLFINTLVLRSRIDDNPSFLELLERIRQGALAGYDHQDVPFEQVVEALQPERNLSHSPLFQVMFVWQNAPMTPLELPGLTITPIEIDSKTAKFDLTLFMLEDDSGITGIWQYNPDLFSLATVERMVNHFQVLLTEIVTNPKEQVGLLPLLSETERHQLLVTWNDTATDYPQDQCIHQLFETQVSTTPDEIAVICDQESLTYEQLNKRSNQLARHLQSLGVTTETLVGLCLERSVDMLVGLLGILKAGGTYVPLDPHYPQERLTYMVADAAVSLLLTQQSLASKFTSADQTLCIDRDWLTIIQHSGENLLKTSSPENLAYIIYTSGSTGRPKGTEILHRGLVNYLSWCIDTYEVAQGTGAPVHSSIGFDATITGLFSPLLVGKTVTLLPATTETTEEVELLAQFLQTQANLSLVKLTPAHLQALNYLLPLEQLADQARFLVLGGEALLTQTTSPWMSHAPNTRLINEYGPTETVVGCCVHQVCPEDLSTSEIPIGRPIANTQLYILDKYLQPTPIGVVGELHIGGAGVARGYLNRPELTDQKFIANPFGSGRLYKTGDLARYRPSGEIEYLGRLDHQVKIRGFRIELGEIEAVLTTPAHIREAVVLAHKDHSGRQRLVAYVVPASPPKSPNSLKQDLKQQLTESLPSYMVPSIFMLLDGLPLTSNGKVDRKALPVPEWEPVREQTMAEPQTPIQKRLADIWQQVLGLEKISLYDNFFSIGGDSILSIQVVSLARQAGLQLRPKQIFQHQTLGELAAVATVTVSNQDLVSSQTKVTGTAPLTPIQHWFLQQQWSEPHHFNQSVMVSVPGDLNLTHLSAALHQVIIHHDALRLRFTRSLSDWEQSHADTCDSVPLDIIDLSKHSISEQQKQLEAIASQQQASLDLESGPLMRAVLFKLNPNQARLLVIIHHLVVDGVSWRILLNDLVTAYGQYVQGIPVKLPLKTTSFQDWAIQLETYAQSATLREQLPYWLNQSPVSPLPVDRSANSTAAAINTVSSEATVTCSLAPHKTAQLLRQVPAAYQTQINDILLTALAKCLGQWSQSSTVLINLEGHGREPLFDSIDLSHTVGWFTSLFPICLQLESETAPGKAIQAVKEQLRQIPDNGIGYGILRYLNSDPVVAEALSSLPLAEISFNYQGQFDELSNQKSSTAWEPAPESKGQQHSPKGIRTHIIDINALIIDGQLQISWTYSENLHQQTTIQQLAQAYVADLEHLITHCLLPDIGGRTPSDFPEAELSQTELNFLLTGLNPRQVEALYPLSPLQQGLLFHSLYDPNSGVYVEQTVLTVNGAIDLSAFRQAWQTILDRHGVLRTHFFWQQQHKPLQIVLKQIELPWQDLDWSHLDANRQQQQLTDYLHTQRQTGFSLDQAPLMKLTLIDLGNDSYHFIWSFHHILLDGWCLPLLFQEVLSLYEAHVNGQTASLLPVRPYRDYIQWLTHQNHTEAEVFWRRTLADLEAPTPLGIGQVHADHTQPTYGVKSLALSEQVTTALQTLVRQQKITLATLVQGVWAILLNRYSGTSDVLFGVTVSGRSADFPGIESMVGLFINTLPLRIIVSQDEPLLPWLSHLHQQQLQIQDYAYSSLTDIQKLSNISGSVALFESIVVFENYPVDAALKNQADVLPIKISHPQEQTNYPLTLVVSPAEELQLRLSYDAERFSDAAISRLLGHLETLMTGIVTHSDRTLGTLPLLTAQEQQQLLVQWNDTDRDYDLDACIHELFEAQAAKTPDAVALLWEEQSFTYRQLNQQAHDLAHYLQALGVGTDASETLVGLCMERSAEMVVGLLAILKAGGAYVPLDPEYPADRIQLILEDAQVTVLLTQRCLQATVSGFDVDGVTLVEVDGEFSRNEQPLQRMVSSGIGSNRLAYLIYTSGSTGRPKGVAIEHCSAVALLHWAKDIFTTEDLKGVLASTSICFDLSVFELFLPLSQGGRIILAANALQLPELPGKGEVTLINTVPSAIAELLRSNSIPPSVRTINLAGEPLKNDLVQRLYQLSHVQQVFNLYGPSEDTTYSTFTCVERGTTQEPSIGRPIANTQAYIVDANMNPVPIGVQGELYLGGAGLAREYFQRPELTQERFVANPFCDRPDARLYKTGDLVRYRTDGCIEFLGRIDRQVKIRGFRIELGEVETTLSRHPNLQDVVVMALGDRPNSLRLVAYIVPEHAATQAPPTVEDMREFIQQTLPNYMVPGAFVTLEALPLTPNGKVDRKALPAPDQDFSGQRTMMRPQTSVQQTLADIWKQVLGLEQVSLYDNFFNVGGDSILSIQVISGAREAGLQITPRQIFQHQTLAELAAVVEVATPTTISQARVNGEVPLTAIQQWFLEQNWSNPEHFNQSVLLSVPGTVDPLGLVTALNQVLLQHDALRLRFTQTNISQTAPAQTTPVQTGQRWQQSYDDAVNAVAFEVIDLSTDPRSEQSNKLETIAAQYQASLNLTTGPLMQAVLFQLAPDQARLLIIIHHLVVDGVSWRILLSDLATAYSQHTQAVPFKLPAKTTSLQDWSRQLQTYAQSTTLQQQASYWLEQPWSAVKPIPVDTPSATDTNTGISVQRVTRILSTAQTHSLLRQVPAVYQTQINDVLLTALAQCLAPWIQSSVVLVNLEGHGREALFETVDLSRTVGWFTSLFPVLLTWDNQVDMGTTLKAIKEHLRQIPQRGIGYGILRYLSQDADITQALAALPSAEISFNYLGQVDEQFETDELPSENHRWGPATESVGLQQSAHDLRPHLLDISAILMDGQLQVSWVYSENIHNRTTIEHLAQGYMEALEALISHCLSPQAGGYTPSDFPEARLTQTGLDNLLQDITLNGVPWGNIEAIYPLSPLQQGMLFHSLYAPESGVYVEQTVMTLQGDLNVAAFQKSWQAVLERHGVLRTQFVWQQLEHPLQVVLKQVEFPWQQMNWQHLETNQQQRELEHWLQNQRHNGFDLTHAPLMQFTLVDLGNQTYHFIWGFHHLLLDGWCMPILFQEALNFYRGYEKNQTVDLPQPRPYRDYIQWLQQQDQEQATAFWRQTLQGIEAPTALGIGQLRSETAIASYTEQSLRLSDTLTTQLQILGREQGITLATLVQAVWALLLSRYSGESDVVFGITVSGRPASLVGVEAMVGLFINTLPLRLSIDRDINVLSWLRQVQQTQVAVQDYLYSSLVEVQRLTDVPSGVPLFESIVVFENYPVDETLQQERSALNILEMEGHEQTNYPLTLAAMPGDRLELEITYDQNRFDVATIERLLGHLQVMLTAIATSPTQTVGQLPLLTQSEHQQLQAWNQTEADYWSDLCVHELFEAQVERTPDAIALEFQHSQLTYRALNQRANQLAHHLRSLGVGPDVLVGICIERSLDMVVGLLGILKAGGAYVPLDPTYPSDRLAYIADDAAMSVLITQQSLVATLPDHQAQLVCLDTDWSIIAEQSTQNPVSGVGREHLIYVLYTSGSTGKPKGVMIPHRALAEITQTIQADYGFSQRDRVLQFASISFDTSAEELYPGLSCGATIVLRTEEVLTSGPDLMDICREWNLSVLDLPTAYWHQVTDELATTDWTVPESLRLVILGGEKARLEHVRLWHNHVASCWADQGLSRPLLANNYGPTEVTIIATSCILTPPNPNDPPGAEASIGPAFRNVHVHLLDRYRQPVPIGVPGEIHVSGVGLARGYLNRPDLTTEKFIPNPFSDSQRFKSLYSTGDIGRYLPDGQVEYLGRVDHQVKLRGFRIEMGEIETALGQHPQIRENVVLVREDQPGRKQLVAYLVFEETALARTELRQWLQDKLPSYMVPSVFVPLDIFPLTPNGKVDRRALPMPDLAAQQRSDDAIPRTDTERALAKIWGDVLRLSQVGVYDNFFELGGDSILSIQIVARATQAGLPITPKQLFQHQTIAELARMVDTATVVQTAQVGVTAEQSAIIGAVALTPIQHWFLSQNLAQSHHFNQSLLLQVESDLNPEHLHTALEHLIWHHDALRLRFIRLETGWHQTHAAMDTAPEQLVHFEVVDLSSWPAAEQSAALTAQASQLQACFDLAAGPLVCAVLFQFGTHQPGRLLLIAHHLIIDGVSWRILLEDLGQSYQQLKQGQLVQLPDKTTAFKTWADHLWEYSQSDRLAAEMDTWLTITTHVTPLPLDKTQDLSQNTVASAATVSKRLTIPETHALLQVVPTAYNTQINDVLLTALVQSFAPWTGSQTLLLELEGHGREDLFETVDISRTVGWFTSLFPLQLDLSLIDDVNDPQMALKTIKEQLRHIPNKGIGYGILRYLSLDSEVRAKLQALPQPQVSFNYLGQFNSAPSHTDIGWAMASEPVGSDVSLQGIRPQLIEINAWIESDQLHCQWTYSSVLHHHSTIEALAQRYQEVLVTLINHCQLPGTGGYTPSDFPDVSLSQGQLDHLLNLVTPQTTSPIAQIPPVYPNGATSEHSSRPNSSTQLDEVTSDSSSLDRPNPAIEAIYTLSPSQQGMWVETMLAPQSGIHVEQSFWQVTGSLNLAALKQAWARMIAHQSILRTAFVWPDPDDQGSNDPVQVVLATTPLPFEYHNWQEFSRDEQSIQLKTYLESDRTQGFDLHQAPLMRLAIFQLDQNTYQLVWTSHHILMDGWCQPLLLQSTMKLYEALCQGQDITLEATRPYREYITWLNQQDLHQAKAFWQSTLQGFKSPTPLGSIASSSPADSSSNSPSSTHCGQQRLLLSATTTAKLNTLVQKQHLTLNILVQGIWALLLSRYSGHSDIVFGMTVSGRPPELPGVESMIGLFINTLPLRVKISVDTPFWSWLQTLQNQQLEIKTYEYCSAGQVHQWSDMPGATPLYESILVFENYPEDISTSDDTSFSLEVTDADSIGAQTQYPLTLLAIPGTELSLWFTYHADRFAQGEITKVCHHFQRLLESLASTPDSSISALLQQIQNTEIPSVKPLIQQQRSQPLVPPRTQLEQQLVQIWSDTLQVASMGVRDSFFEMGGHSLLAVQLMGYIQSTFGVHLPLSTLLQHPTIEQLAQYLESPTAATPWSSLVPIQTQGTCPPLFCVPGGGGNVLYFYELSRCLGADQPFYGLQSQGLDGESQPLTDIVTIATHYIELIRTVQPEGPYHLAGHSFGGLVIFEMARQLLAQGQQIQFLGILDTTAPLPNQFHVDLSDWTDTQWIVALARSAQGISGIDFHLSEELLAPLSPSQQFECLQKRFVEAGILPDSGSEIQLRGFLEVFKANGLSSDRYIIEPTAISLPVTLFRAAQMPDVIESTESLLYEPTYGWNQLSTSPVDVQSVPGTHLTMMAQPQVQILAEKMALTLRKSLKN